MKKHWLPGVLLGVSLALLLAGGVALAQSLTVEPECFQCWPGTDQEFEQQQPGYPYTYTWESCGWTSEELLYYRETFANGEYWGNYYVPDDGCIAAGPWTWFCLGGEGHHAGNATVGNAWVWPDDFWGPFEICVSPGDDGPVPVSADQIVCDTILFAEQCPAQVEFVPEPGSVLLLGSGLAGLAGYAALRWRTRQ